MPEATTTPAVPSTLDVGRIEDPEVRRVLRAIQVEYCSKIARIQLEIDSILEVLFDKHITSIGEFKREIARMGQNSAKTDRLHEALSAAPGTPTPVMASIRPHQ